MTGAEIAPELPPDIAVVIPAWRQPALLEEAILSVLAQRGPRRVAAVVVDDGCPMPETRAAALRFATAHPGRVFLLRKANGGLSAARNTGIDFVLRAWPGCRAVFFLDADNRLGPLLIHRAAALLEASGPETGWIYPDFDFFGIPGHASAAGEHSLFMHLLENTSDAGSLVSRRVLDAGLRFDEGMRQGFEDWDFWLRAGAAGFRGRHLPMSGFAYRRRAGGMRVEAERRRAAILAGMRAALRPLARPQRLLALESAEVPRFLLYRAGSPIAEPVVDPLRPGRAPLDRAAARRQIVEASRHPQAVHAPPFLLFAALGALEALAAGRLLHNVLWQAEILLRGADAVGIALAAGPAGRLGLERVEGMPEGPALLLYRTESWQESAALGAPVASAARRRAGLRVILPDVPTPSDPLAEAEDEYAALAETFATRHPDRGEWRGDWRRPRARAHLGYGELIGAGAVLPWVTADARDVALAAPVFEMGGVERVLVGYARALRQAGWRPHLVVTGAGTALVPADALAAFETVQFPARGGIEGVDPNTAHLGAPLPGASGLGEGTLRDAVGQLAPMAAVLATHARGVHAIAGALRGIGIRTVAGLHVVEREAAGAPMGNPHALLAHEGDYDAVAVVSEGLRDWGIAQGIPASKILLLPNGPGHEAAPGTAAAALAAREGRDGRLRALFLGRLDPQKGLDRLRDIVALTPWAEWRAAGRAVLGREPEPIPGLDIEPPADGNGVDALLAWADVLVLPSRFEGSPLIILEAQRMGCVPLVTQTGAVAEMVADGVDGLLVEVRADPAVSAAFADRLAALSVDRGLLLALARGAAARAAALPDLATRTRPLLDWLQAGQNGPAEPSDVTPEVLAP
ncbi:glycosyltransferase [Pararoseomonas indoligenes]|uniref:Glycosyltransferase n=1 Tax=Roseomonas indoligenes TaxID=2820811 RepID=A0A940MWP3_9PROT|nr:glycosyltransferase [Pararoseomonas indoligenes]MBP0494794.1 glycosyltransferase [Pararoseomonas indoligenes]